MIRSRIRTARRGRIVFGTVVLGALGIAITNALRAAPDLDPPPPEIIEDEDWVPPLPPSRLTVPVVADLSSIVDRLERAVPQRHGSLDDRQLVDDHDRLEIAYELQRSPFEVELRGDTVHLRALIAYRVRAWYDAPVLPTFGVACGDDPDELAPRAVVTLATPLELSENWVLQSDPRVVRVAPFTNSDRDRCRLSAIKIDVTERLVQEARSLIEERLPEIQEAIAAVDVRATFQEWWDLLGRPIRLDEDAWLLLDPLRVARGSVVGSGLKLSAEVTLTASPRLLYGRRPSPDPRPLPPLEAEFDAQGLAIRAVAATDYGAASDWLNRALAGQAIEQSGNTLVIEWLELSGIGGGRVALEARVTGTANGRVYLVGKPTYDEVSGTIHVPDLEFDVATLNLLVGGLDWLAHEEFVAFLRDQARWPAGDLVMLAQEQLEQGLNAALAEGVRLEGRVESVRILGIHPTRAVLQVHASATADARLIVEG